MAIFFLLKVEVDHEGGTFWNSQRQFQKRNLLNCRLVHSQWKKTMDDVLEKLNLEYYTNLIGSDIRPIYSLPYINVNWSRNGASVRELLVPGFVSDDSPFGIQIPTKSVLLQMAHVRRKSLKRGNLFINVGANLSCLLLGNLYPFLTAGTLSEVLQCTPNLKALNLRCLKLKFSEQDVNSTLPPLPHLVHLRCTTLQIESLPKEFNVFEWIVGPYKNQILTLETDSINGFWQAPITFPKLELWKITSEVSSEIPKMCPLLHHLSLESLYFDDIREPVWPQILDFVAQFSSGLMNLNLDINWLHQSAMNLPPFEIRSVGDAFKRSVFSLVKTFKISYPETVADVWRLRYILTKFPNLKYLRLNFHGCDPDVVTETEREGVKTLVEHEEYWKICPLLKKIVVQLNAWNKKTEFIEWQRPA